MPVPPPPPQMERNSTGMMVAGIVMTAVGGAGLLTGLFVYAVDTQRQCVFAETAAGGSIDSACETKHSVPGILMMVTGGVSLAAGIPILVIGARQVPVDRPPEAALTPELRVGPSRASLAWRF